MIEHGVNACSRAHIATLTEMLSPGGDAGSQEEASKLKKMARASHQRGPRLAHDFFFSPNFLFRFLTPENVVCGFFGRKEKIIEKKETIPLAISVWQRVRHRRTRRAPNFCCSARRLLGPRWTSGSIPRSIIVVHSK